MPEACLGLAKGRDPTLSQDAGSGKRDDLPGIAEGSDLARLETLDERAAQSTTARSSSLTPFATDTIRSSPDDMSRKVQTRRASSSSPRMAV